MSNKTTMHQAPADRDKQIAAIARGLAAIDDNVRAHGYPGEPGSGLFLLLENVAAQLGINRTGFPVEAPAPAAIEETETEEEAAKKEAERKEAERHASRSRR